MFTYLLRGLKIERPHQVWAIDITYVRLRGGFAYLAALLEWFSRYATHAQGRPYDGRLGPTISHDWDRGWYTQPFAHIIRRE